MHLVSLPLNFFFINTKTVHTLQTCAQFISVFSTFYFVPVHFVTRRPVSTALLRLSVTTRFFQRATSELERLDRQIKFVNPLFFILVSRSGFFCVLL